MTKDSKEILNQIAYYNYKERNISKLKELLFQYSLKYGFLVSAKAYKQFENDLSDFDCAKLEGYKGVQNTKALLIGMCYVYQSLMMNRGQLRQFEILSGEFGNDIESISYFPIHYSFNSRTSIQAPGNVLKTFELLGYIEKVKDSFKDRSSGGR